MVVMQTLIVRGGEDYFRLILKSLQHLYPRRPWHNNVQEEQVRPSAITYRDRRFAITAS